MARRRGPGRPGRQRHDREDEDGGGLALDRRYEGPDVLDRLLSRVGASLDARGVIARFCEALAAGRGAPETIPALFPAEPRFGGPEDALRLYGNLLGLWDLLSGGAEPAELLVRAPPPAPGPSEPEEAEGEERPPEPEPEPEPAPGGELPVRGSVAGREIPTEVVEGTWRQLAGLPSRERVRRHDRYGSYQPDLAEWARTVEGLGPGAQETLELLCFELFEMADRAFGDRVGAVRFAALAGAGPERGRALQPQVVTYVRESLDEAEAEDVDPLLPGERPAVEARAFQALAALTDAVESLP